MSKSLQSALAALEKPNIAAMKLPINTIKEYRRIVNAAARSLAEGETIWWCEEHEASAQYEEERCDFAALGKALAWTMEKPCLMVEKILADPQ